METTIINKFGQMQGWNQVTVNLLGRDIEGITALKYDDSVNKENVYGAGQYPIGRSAGNYEATCSITLFKEEIDAIQKALPAGRRLSDIPAFDIEVVYVNPNGQAQKDRIRNCEFSGRAVDVGQGDTTLALEYPIICSHIEWNV